MARRIAVLVLACAFGGMLTTAAWSFASRGTCGPSLCAAPERGWFSSVGPGVVETRPAAWVLLGNFRFPADAAGHEASPAVPVGKVLVSFGDFPVVRAYADWRRVRHLGLPGHPTAKRQVSWHVRYAGRAVFLHVSFGSQPTTGMWRLANAKLDTIRRKQG